MFNESSATEYQHLTIKDIREKTSLQQGNYVLIVGTSKQFNYTTRITVLVNGRLQDYVLNELSVRDNIFVVGYSINLRIHKYHSERVIVAMYIYKEDWMRYYGNPDAVGSNYEYTKREIQELIKDNIE